MKRLTPGRSLRAAPAALVFPAILLLAVLGTQCRRPAPGPEPQPPLPGADFPPAEYTPPPELSGFFTGVAAALPPGAGVTIDPFTLLPDDRETLLTQCLTWSAEAYFAHAAGLPPRCLLRCTAHPVGDAVILRVRAVNIETREVLHIARLDIRAAPEIQSLLAAPPLGSPENPYNWSTPLYQFANADIPQGSWVMPSSGTPRPAALSEIQYARQERKKRYGW